MKTPAYFSLLLLFLFSSTDIGYCSGSSDRDLLIGKQLDCLQKKPPSSKNLQWNDICYTNASDMNTTSSESAWTQADRRHYEITPELDALENKNISEETTTFEPPDINSKESSAWERADRRHRKLPQKIKEDEKNKFKMSDETARENGGPPPKRIKQHEISAAWQASNYKYEEPDLMHVKGPSFGIAGNYTYRPSKKDPLYNKIVNTYRVDGQANKMTLKYASVDGVRNEDEKHSMYEVRGLLGREYYSKDVRVLVYSGLGYRYLLDDNGGEALQNPATGLYNVLSYDRESNYYYIPAGGEIEFPQDNWSLTLKGEYDFLVYGKQISHFTDTMWYPGIGPGEDTHNNQHHGFGIKGSFQVAYKMDAAHLFVEPFIDYWNIEDSDISYCQFDGEYGYGLEPKNKTTAYGVRLGVKF